jgi:hypothetical protein
MLLLPHVWSLTARIERRLVGTDRKGQNMRSLFRRLASRNFRRVSRRIKLIR